MFLRTRAKPGLLDLGTELPTAHTGQYRDSPAAPAVPGLLTASLLSPNQGHEPTLGLTDYYSPRLTVTQGRRAS